MHLTRCVRLVMKNMMKVLSKKEYDMDLEELQALYPEVEPWQFVYDINFWKYDEIVDYGVEVLESRIRLNHEHDDDLQDHFYKTFNDVYNYIMNYYDALESNESPELAASYIRSARESIRSLYFKVCNFRYPYEHEDVINSMCDWDKLVADIESELR